VEVLVVGGARSSGDSDVVQTGENGADEILSAGAVRVQLNAASFIFPEIKSQRNQEIRKSEWVAQKSKANKG
jgi:hypothetical protein